MEVSQIPSERLAELFTIEMIYVCFIPRERSVSIQAITNENDASALLGQRRIHMIPLYRRNMLHGARCARSFFSLPRNEVPSLPRGRANRCSTLETTKYIFSACAPPPWGSRATLPKRACAARRNYFAIYYPSRDVDLK